MGQASERARLGSSHLQRRLGIIVPVFSARQGSVSDQYWFRAVQQLRLVSYVWSYESRYFNRLLL